MTNLCDPRLQEGLVTEKFFTEEDFLPLDSDLRHEYKDLLVGRRVPPQMTIKEVIRELLDGSPGMLVEQLIEEALHNRRLRKGR